MYPFLHFNRSVDAEPELSAGGRSRGTGMPCSHIPDSSWYRSVQICWNIQIWGFWGYVLKLICPTDVNMKCSHDLTDIVSKLAWKVACLQIIKFHVRWGKNMELHVGMFSMKHRRKNTRKVMGFILQLI